MAAYRLPKAETGVRFPSPAPKMTNPKLALKNDKYKKARAGYSKLLDVHCASCKCHLCCYQKDGLGVLKRMYLDRMVDHTFDSLTNKSIINLPQLRCPACKKLIGIPMIYKKEQRPAYRLLPGSITKKTITSKNKGYRQY